MELYQIEMAFQAAAKIADQVGYDFILIQCSFNLVEDSMNAKTNKRTDAYADLHKFVTNIF